MFLLYNLLLTILAPFWVPWMLWRAHKRGEKPNWRERQGDYRESIPKKGDRPRLWVHAVSVGEFVASQPLLRELRKALPEHEIVLSVTTSSGHQTARDASERLYDYLVYLPIDVARFTLSAMQRVRPDALIVLETELWTNLFWAAKTFDAKVFVVNARLSDRSFPRAQKLGAFYRTLLRMVDGVFAQSETDAGRFRELGAAHAESMGNIKFDQALEGVDDETDWRKELGLDERPVVIVGSLRAEEFAELADVIAHSAPGVSGSMVARGEPTAIAMQWIVAPRHLDRTAALDEALRSADIHADGVPLSIGYRSKGEHAFVTILDTYGELSRIYRIADVVIVGGSFKKLGGQNIIQPLAQSKPVLHGPYMANFRDIATLAARSGAAVTCQDGADLAGKLADLLEDPARRLRMGDAARRLVEENRGASVRMAKAIASNLKG